MSDWFFYGTLCHPPLLRVVLGRDVSGVDANLTGHAVHWAAGQDSAVLVTQREAVARGVLVRGLSSDEAARLEFYEASFGRSSSYRSVQVTDGPLSVRVFIGGEQIVPAALWQLADWQRRFGPSVIATAADIMRLYGVCNASSVAVRHDQMLSRGASRVRAAIAGPVALRFAAEPCDVVVASQRQPYAHFFAVEEYDLCYRRFDRTLTPVVTRAVFVSCDAVTVLPYDPMRDRVLVIEQFRAGPLGRGDVQPWLIETIAGRIDPGENAEDCARREAMEEAGLALGTLLPVAQYYPSPGASAEYLYSYVALTDLPDGVEGVFGLEGETEDIRGHLIEFDELMALVASGEVANASLILTALWLQRERPRLCNGQDLTLHSQ